MRLLDLLEGISWECLQGKRSMEGEHSMEEWHSMEEEHAMEEAHSMEGEHSMEKEVSAVVYDSRKIVEGCLFICIEGVNFDGHAFAAEAAEKGAAALLVSKPVEGLGDKDIAVIKVEDTRYAMAFVSAAWFGHPAKKLKTIGITGTKGKTTTTYLVKSILENAGLKVGLIGTIETVIGDVHIHAENTTPEFDYGIFTNLEPDHIGPREHESFEEYMECKGRLFRQCLVGIVNCDDNHVGDIVEGHSCELETYGTGEGAMLRAESLELVHTPGELGVNFHVAGLMDFDAHVPAPGRFSVYNALCAIAICRHFRVGTADIQSALRTAKVKGRIERVKISDRFTLLIDYAHNAMALESLLSTLKEYEPRRLVCLFGCGGNRSRQRRYEMGEVSGRLADFTVITSDNPRFEEPQDIIEDIKTGIGKTEGRYVEICDRREAIAYAISHAEEGDLIVLAGKGHEDYQEIRGVKYPMDERVIIEELLAGGLEHI